MPYHALEKTGNLNDDYRKTFRLEGYHLLLLVHEGRPYVVDNICPHAGYPMVDGLIIDDQLRCPMHGYLFDINSGHCNYSSEGPCRGIKIYPVIEQGDEVGVELERKERLVDAPGLVS